MEKTINHRVIKPTDKDVWDLMQLQWDLYLRASKGRYYNRDFPWYDSDKLDKLYADKNTRRQAELFFWYLTPKAWDMEKQKQEFGIEGATIALKQAYAEYEKISYYLDNPDKNVPRGYKSWDDLTLTWFANWLADRGNFGLSNTVSQFIGHQYPDDIKTMDQLKEIIEDKSVNGLTQHLKKQWQYWDLVKFIAGYERWNPDTGRENYSEFYITTSVLRMFGFPEWNMGFDPYKPGAGSGEWGITLPDYIASGLKEKYKDSVLIGPGNLFGLISSKNSLKQDGIKGVWINLRGKLTYLWKN